MSCNFVFQYMTLAFFVDQTINLKCISNLIICFVIADLVLGSSWLICHSHVYLLATFGGCYGYCSRHNLLTWMPFHLLRNAKRI